MNLRIRKDVDKLFEYWCEVKYSDVSRIPTITESFPESYKDAHIISKLPEFAFPYKLDITSMQTYSFVSTSDDSKFRFGFCSHDPITQTAMVLITYLPWHDTFLKLITFLSELRRCNYRDFRSFLIDAYNKGISELGNSTKFYYNKNRNYFIIQRPSELELPSVPENNNLSLYYNFVEPTNMIGVFSSMLAERRIVFTSRYLDRLSACVQAASAFLYPMVWQHIFIPILPMKMKDILCAPMPYLIGVPETVLETMTTEELGEIVILNCDTNDFKSPFDDVKEMPADLVSQLKKSLGNTPDLTGDRISRIFLRILVHLIGGYRDAVKYSQYEKITWNRDIFIDSRPQHLKNFLKRMMELQIFQQFIDERLEILNSGQGISDEFEMESLRLADKFGRKGKNYCNFLRNMKDKERRVSGFITPICYGMKNENAAEAWIWILLVQIMTTFGRYAHFWQTKTISTPGITNFDALEYTVKILKLLACSDKPQTFNQMEINIHREISDARALCSKHVPFNFKVVHF